MAYYTAYTITCLAGLAMFMWVMYDLGDFKKSVRPEVWVFIVTVKKQSLTFGTEENLTFNFLGI